MNLKSVRAAVLLCCVVSSAVALAATIKGSVSDKYGLVIPGVTVTVTNEQSSEKHSAVSNEAGMFRVPNLTPGHYSIQTEISGFKTTKLSNVNVKDGKDTSVKLTIDIGVD